MPDAFVGAIGHGAPTRHAYTDTTPTIHTIDNLNDSGSNSFANEVLGGSNRNIIPQVSGRINATGRYTLSNSNIWLAGQAAPTPGLTLYGSEFRIYQADDILIEHLRIMGKPDETRNFDSIFLWESNNIYLNHCSFIWPNDEPISVANCNNVTFDRCLIEGKRAPYPAQDHWGCVMGWEQTDPDVTRPATNVTFYGCLFVNCNARNPKITSGCHAEYINCFWVNCGDASDGMSQIGTKFEGNTDAILADFIECAYIIGPESSATGYPLSKYNKGPTTGTMIYVSNVLHLDDISSPTEGRRQSTASGSDWDVVNNSQIPSGTYQAGTPQVSSGITAQGVVTAYADVVTAGNVGTRPADREDSAIEPDASIMGEARDVSTAVHKTESNVTVPSYAQNSLTFSVPASPHVDSGSGYTNLEVALATERAKVEPEDAAGGETGTPIGVGSMTYSVTTRTLPDNANTFNILLPASIPENAIIIIPTVVDGNTTVVTWDDSTAGTWANLVTEQNNEMRSLLKWKRADGTEGGKTLSIGFDTIEEAIASIIVIEGAHTTTDPEASAVNVDTDAVDPPSISPSGWDASAETSLAIAIAHNDHGDIAYSGFPSGYTDTQSTATGGTTGVGQAIAFKEFSSEPENPSAFAASATDGTVGYTIALRPAPAEDEEVVTPTPDTSFPRRFWQQCIK